MTLPFTFDTLCSFLADYHKRIRTENILYIVSAKQLYKDLEVAAPAPVIAEPPAVPLGYCDRHRWLHAKDCGPSLPPHSFPCENWKAEPAAARPETTAGSAPDGLGLESVAAPTALAAATPAVTGAPAEPEEYPHLMICNGSRRYPAGIPGHGCCCFNIGTEYLQMAARKMRADGAAAVPADEGLREALGQFQKAYSHFRAYLPDGNYEGIGLLTEAYSRVAALTLHEVK